MISKQLSLAVMFVGIAAGALVGVLALPNAVTEVQSEESGIMGHLTLILTSPDGEIKQYVQTDNLVTFQGKDCIVENLFAADGASCSTAADFNNIGLGISSGAGTGSSDVVTALASACVRAVADTSVSDGGGATQKVTITASFGGTGAGGGDTINDNACEVTVTEAGLFNNVVAAAGDMFSYQSFSSVTIGDADSLTVNWEITFGD